VDLKKQQNRVLRLARILHVADDTWMGTNPGWGKPENKKERSQAAPSFESPIISAARNGIIEIVNLILEEYPMATEVINDREENIFHVAARCRRKEILDRLHLLPPQLLRIGGKINIDGDSILHQAAYLDKHQLRDRPGEALHMQSEIQWFKVLTLLSLLLSFIVIIIIIVYSWVSRALLRLVHPQARLYLQVRRLKKLSTLIEVMHFLNLFSNN
jgi:hypothetical protein